MPDSEDANEATPPPARPLNRWGIGTMSALQIVLLAALLLAANFIALRHYNRVDVSREGAYTLSPATVRYLGEGMGERTQPIRWTLAFRRSNPYYERVRALAEEYQRWSRGGIVLEIVDPLRAPERAEQVMASYGLTFARDMIIIDARDGDDGEAITTDAAGIRSLNPHVRLAIVEDMVVTRADSQGTRRPVGFQGEDVMTAQLVAAIEGRARQMLFLADKSRIDDDGEDSPWGTLERALRMQNIALTPARLSEMRSIPESVEGIVIVAPRFDFSEEEIAMLESYWQRPRSAMLVLLDAAETPRRLRAFLRSNGITPRRDRVIAREDGRLVTMVRGTFAYQIDFLADLAGQAVTFDGASASLEVREGADELVDRGITPMSLVDVAPGFWGETRFGEGDETFDPTEDHGGQLSLAAAVTRGVGTDDRFAAETSRMVVTSNADFLDPDRARAEALDFLATSVNWLVDRESLAGIGPRPLGTYKLPLLDAQVSFINRVNLIFLPAFLLLLGGLVWSSRRS
jgi:hypothetical protein